jgi:hypothetical protein
VIGGGGGLFSVGVSTGAAVGSTVGAEGLGPGGLAITDGARVPKGTFLSYFKLSSEVSNQLP